MATTSATSSSITTALTGCVKWFDNGLNYGFITVLSDGDHKNTDIFIHQSNIRTARDCFRTLYTGECVQFELAKSDNEKHPYHAVNVSGYNGTLLHCENPNYRPRGFRGGRGGQSGRGGQGGRGGQSGRVRAETIVVSTTQDTPSSVPTEQTARNDSVDVSKATGTTLSGRGRGRGRGKKTV
jgi:cold shock CspA family protein